jgi:hypothetical protein
MDNLNLILYDYIEQIRLHPDKLRKIDLIFSNPRNRGNDNLMIIIPHQDFLLVRLNIPMTDRDVAYAEQHLGVQLLDIPENEITILIFPTVMDMNIQSTVEQRKTFVNIIRSYIQRVMHVTRKTLTRVDLYEYSHSGQGHEYSQNNGNNLHLLYTHNVSAGDPVRPLTPPRRNVRRRLQ